MNLADHSLCTGCGACAEVCPEKAIIWHDDDEGFPNPYIIESQCLHCGVCEKVCPVLYKPTMNTIIAAYAAQVRDQNDLHDSTSGGMFTLFAREVLKHSGVVYGCVWDREYNALITKAESEDEMKPMRGSKYVWSRAKDTYPEIKTYLAHDRLVMFSGLPCQVAGLKNYLKKDYKNLILLDFLCSGSPSPLAFDKYLETLCKKEDRANLNLKFRDKEPYGAGVHITYNGQRNSTKPGKEHITNPYYYSFYTRLIDRESCYTCPYGTRNRVSDITVGDFWGGEFYHKDLAIKEGVSALMINTSKGEEMLKRVIDQVEIRVTAVENIAKHNNLSASNEIKPVYRPSKRKDFFKTLRDEGWSKAERKYLFTKARLKSWLKLSLPKAMVSILSK